MSSDRPSLRERFGADLRAGSLPVLLTAVPIAMAVGLGSTWYWDEFVGGFLLLVTIGVIVPSVHEAHWPQDRSWAADVLWTVAASAVAIALFAATYLLAGFPVDDPTHRAAIAFVAASLGGWSLSWAIRRGR